MAKVFDRHGRVNAFDEKYTGQEPTWTGDVLSSQESIDKQFSSALNFYAYYLSGKDLLPDLLKYMDGRYKTDEIKLIKKFGDKLGLITASKIARMINRGMPIGDNARTIENLIRPAISEARNMKEVIEQKTADKPKISIQERMNNKVNDKVIYHLDMMIDDNGWATHDVKVKGIDVTTLLKAGEIPVAGLKQVTDWLETLKHGLVSAYTKTDSDYVEGYSYLSRPAINNRIKEIDKMLTQVEKYRGANTKARKPRKKKVKSADAQVKNMKYKESDDDFGISSVAPSVVPGSKKLFAFNTKYRRLTMYEANSTDGLGVKGTTMQNFDIKSSFELTLRKPDDILPLITNKTEKQISKVIDALKTKKKAPNGRINNETILLRTF